MIPTTVAECDRICPNFIVGSDAPIVARGEPMNRERHDHHVTDQLCHSHGIRRHPIRGGKPCNGSDKRLEEDWYYVFRGFHLSNLANG
jgi:hypothetical protein